LKPIQAVGFETFFISHTNTQTQTEGVSHMQIARCVQNIQRAETVSKYKDEQNKKHHFEKYQNATKTEKLKLFHSAIAEGWVN